MCLFSIRNRPYEHKKGIVWMTIFPPVCPGFSCLTDGNIDIIGRTAINQIFLLQKESFSYKLNYYKSGQFLELEVG